MTDLFDSPWKIAIIAVLIIVLFGARKLPIAARSLGKSMRILKAEMTGLHHDDDEDEPAQSPTVQAAPAQLQTAQAAPDTQAQIAALSKQLTDLQQSVSANSADNAQAK